jgi:hypothetical protein
MKFWAMPGIVFADPDGRGALCDSLDEMQASAGAIGSRVAPASARKGRDELARRCPRLRSASYDDYVTLLTTWVVARIDARIT